MQSVELCFGHVSQIVLGSRLSVVSCDASTWRKRNCNACQRSFLGPQRANALGSDWSDQSLPYGGGPVTSLCVSTCCTQGPLREREREREREGDRERERERVREGERERQRERERERERWRGFLEEGRGRLWNVHLSVASSWAQSAGDTGRLLEALCSRGNHASECREG
jgi:hypothetical protein